MDRRFTWIGFVAAVLLAVAVGVVSYNAGVSHGLVVSVPAQAQGAAPGAAVPVPPPYGPYYGYGWYRPWGFGFFGPFLFIFVLFMLSRVFFWGAFHRRRWHHAGQYDVPAPFEEWHRRAHERMSGQSGPQGSA
jgi:hypothetical protein